MDGRAAEDPLQVHRVVVADRHGGPHAAQPAGQQRGVVPVEDALAWAVTVTGTPASVPASRATTAEAVAKCAWTCRTPPVLTRSACRNRRQSSGSPAARQAPVSRPWR